MIRSSYKKLFFILMPLFPHIPNRFMFSLKEIIYRDFVNFKFFLYNGKTWTTRVFSAYMTGYKIGSFVFTRKKAIFKKNQKKSKKK